MRWLGRDDRTMMGRLLIWRGKADQAHITELTRVLGLPAGDARRHRVGRPARRWEDVAVEARGNTWFDTAGERDLIPLADAIGAE